MGRVSLGASEPSSEWPAGDRGQAGLGDPTGTGRVPPAVGGPEGSAAAAAHPLREPRTSFVKF